MKKLVILTILAAGLVIGTGTRSFASDWDKAGKALAIIEGVRVITGGKIDVIGTVTGINRPRESSRDHDRYAKGHDRDHDRARYAHERNYPVAHREMVWVPHYVWVEKYVPEHKEYRQGYGDVLVRGHYEKYQVEQGGHWEEVCKYY